ncbi:hypothetical protein [uncultured Hymenobacter sp.]|uniref:hypothetical protein n=1 Tax=uncultured Hymenobacter sp. TaxID=170016 RepID=UPI0035CB74AA
MTPTTQKTAQDFAHIKGWGIDADPHNNPVYPMNERAEGSTPGRNYERPPQQPVDVELLQTIERASPSAVFGTTVPPSGLSGLIRRFAFKYSENRYRHWLPLLVADRVQVVEGVLDDLVHGHVPNIWAEKGYNAEWKHKPQQLVVKLTVTALATAGLIAWLSSGSKSKKSTYGSRPVNLRIRSAARG